MQNYDYKYEPKLPETFINEHQKYEIHEGKIYLMAGTTLIHSTVSGNIFTIFKNFLKGKKCRVFGEGANVVFEKGKHEYLPDIKIVCGKNNILKNDRIMGAPDLIVEVLSPKTMKNDKGYKKDMYEKYGVKEYWIVSPKERSVEVYLLKDGVYKLDDVYNVYKDDEYEDLTDEEKKQVQTHFKTSIPEFEDLTISVEEVFEDIDIWE